MGDVKLHSGMTVNELLAEAMAAFGDSEMFTFDETHASYREYGERSARLANALCELGLQKGENVALLLPTSLDFAYSYMAITLIGCASVPLNPLYRERELRHILSQTEAAAVILAPTVRGNDLLGMIRQLKAELPAIRHLIVTADPAPEGTVSLASLLAHPNKEPPPDRPDKEDNVIITYTSGTTGFPRAAVHCHRSLIGSMLGHSEIGFDRKAPGAQQFMMRYGARLAAQQGKQKVSMDCMPYYALSGSLSILGALHNGERLVVLERFDPIRVLELIEKERINTVTIAPSMCAIMMDCQDFERYDKSSLSYMVVTTAYTAPQLARKIEEGFGCPIILPMGATELGGGTCATRFGDGEKEAYESVGRVNPGVGVKIVDDERRELPAGEVGELAFRSEGLMKGYYKAPEETAEVTDAEGWYYTGDLAMLDERGYVWMKGRKKDMINRAGQKIHPNEVEGYLLTHPCIRYAALIGVPSRFLGESTWAYVVPKEGMALTAEDVKDHCRGKIASFKIPDEVRIVDSLPMTGTEKARKFMLVEMALQELQQKHAHETAYQA
jgi:fatty-acyl-CoA synthase